MNENLTNRIKEYLILDTSYAVIINGDYGKGKTHYVKNKLFPVIKKIKIPNKEKTEFFTPILVSLFGIKTIEEVQRNIFVELYPILKNKGVNLASNVGKGLLKFISGKDIEDLAISTGNFIDYNDILLCIDDIDRKSDSLDLKELFGFINNLVENTNAKILIIANEDELIKGFKGNSENYSILREKVIGVSINFKSNVPNIFDEIIKEKYESKNIDYFNFLKENKNEIITVIEQNKDNLRNLIFFLEQFKIIYNTSNSLINNETSLKNYSNKILKSMLSFALPISVEYKLGKLNSTNSTSISDLYLNVNNFSRFLGLSDLSTNEEEKERSYKEIYETKYLNQNNNKQYFDTIFNYIIGNSIFDEKKIISELKLIYKIENNSIPEREQILEQLSYWRCVDLEYIDYRKLTIKMLKFVDKGEYHLDQYNTAFHYATRFNNPINYNIGNLKKRFNKGIIKGKPNFSYISKPFFKFSISDNTEFYSDQKEILDYCLKVNKEIENEYEENKVIDLFKLFQTDLTVFWEKVEDTKGEFYFTPYLTKFNFSKFWKEILKFENTQLINLAFYFRHRYKQNIFEELYPEKDFLIKFKVKLKHKIKQNSTKKMNKIGMDFLITKIEDAINNFP